MPRIDADKLITNILSDKLLPGLNIVLSDLPIFHQLAEERFRKQHMNVERFEGKGAILEFVESAGSANLFGTPSASLIELNSKYTEKQWKEELTHLKRIGNYSEVPGFLFGPTSLRHAIKETKDAPPLWLCYSPQDSELIKCAEKLASRYNELSKNNLSEIAAFAVEQYAGDLVSIDLHFDRMAKFGSSAKDASLMQSEVTSFQVVDALCKADKAAVELRIQQCEASGEDAGAIFSAVTYFMRQFLQVKARHENQKNLKAVLDELRIPFPSHGRMQLALKNLSADAVNTYFLAAPCIELEIRKSKNPYSLLAYELLGLLKS